MTERYLEVFAVGRRMAPAGCRLTRSGSSALLRNSIRSLSISTPRQRSTRYFTVW